MEISVYIIRCAYRFNPPEFLSSTTRQRMGHCCTSWLKRFFEGLETCTYTGIIHSYSSVRIPPVVASPADYHPELSFSSTHNDPLSKSFNFFGRWCTLGMGNPILQT